MVLECRYQRLQVYCLATSACASPMMCGVVLLSSEVSASGAIDTLRIISLVYRRWWVWTCCGLAYFCLLTHNTLPQGPVHWLRQGKRRNQQRLSACPERIIIHPCIQKIYGVDLLWTCILLFVDAQYPAAGARPLAAAGEASQ